MILKKELAELTFVSYILFISLTLFVLMTFVMLVFDSNFTAEGISSDILYPKASWSTINAVSVCMLSYSYQQNVFAIYSELRNKSNAEYQKMSKRGLPFTGLFYFLVGIICCLMFGPNLESSVLLNIGRMRHPDGSAFWEAYIL